MPSCKLKILYIYNNHSGDASDISASGVSKKIAGISNAINKLGHEAEVFGARSYGIGKVIEVVKFIAQSNANTYIIRDSPAFTVTLAYSIVKKRMMGAKFILEVPTPFTNASREMWGAERKSFGSLIKLVLVSLGRPVNNIFFNRIIQYAPESAYFSMFARKKMLIASNGLDVHEIPPPEKKHNNGKLRMVAVAHLQFWHGYDRLIRSIRRSIDTHPALGSKLFLTVIGDGPEKERLVSLVNEMNLERLVNFTGAVPASHLKKYFDRADIGVSALGLHREKLFFSSQLKVREYLGHGLPIIHAGTDPDLRSDLDFVFKVSNDESEIDMNKIYESYMVMEEKNPNFHKTIRSFAEAELDFSKKIFKQYLDIL